VAALTASVKLDGGFSSPSLSNAQKEHFKNTIALIFPDVTAADVTILNIFRRVSATVEFSVKQTTPSQPLATWFSGYLASEDFENSLKQSSDFNQLSSVAVTKSAEYVNSNGASVAIGGSNDDGEGGGDIIVLVAIVMGGLVFMTCIFTAGYIYSHNSSAQTSDVRTAARPNMHHIGAAGIAYADHGGAAPGSYTNAPAAAPPAYHFNQPVPMARAFPIPYDATMPGLTHQPPPPPPTAHAVSQWEAAKPWDGVSKD